jgi:hypothetical protein
LQRQEVHNVADISSLRSRRLRHERPYWASHMRLRSSRPTSASAEPGLPPSEHRERLPDMELERQALKARSSSGSISTNASSKGRKKPVRVVGLELSPELVAIALGELAVSDQLVRWHMWRHHMLEHPQCSADGQGAYTGDEMLPPCASTCSVPGARHSWPC